MARCSARPARESFSSNGRWPRWTSSKRPGYHVRGVVGIRFVRFRGLSPFRAVFFRRLLAVALGFVDRGSAVGRGRRRGALYAGAGGVLPAGPTRATAGIIVG